MDRKNLLCKNEKCPVTTPMLHELLTEETVIVNTSISNWKEAIMKSGQLLLNIDAIEPRYIDAMIKFCEEYQAYIVIAPGIALPHARPEDGVKKMCLSLLTLKNPVEFGHPQNDPVDLVIALGMINSKSHVEALASLAEILMDTKKLEKIRNAQIVQDILNIFKNQE